MRLATAADEILPLRDPRVQQNEAYLAVIVLARVITRLGTLPDIHTGVDRGAVRLGSRLPAAALRDVQRAATTTEREPVPANGDRRQRRCGGSPRWGKHEGLSREVAVRGDGLHRPPLPLVARRADAARASRARRWCREISAINRDARRRAAEPVRRLRERADGTPGSAARLPLPASRSTGSASGGFARVKGLLARDQARVAIARAASTTTSTSWSRRSSYPVVVLERGLALDDLWKWALRRGRRATSSARRSAIRAAGRGRRRRPGRWQIEHAFPVKWTASDLDAQASQVRDGEPRARAPRAEEGDMKLAQPPSRARGGARCRGACVACASPPARAAGVAAGADRVCAGGVRRRAASAARASRQLRARGQRLASGTQFHLHLQPSSSDGRHGRARSAPARAIAAPALAPGAPIVSRRPTRGAADRLAASQRHRGRDDHRERRRAPLAPSMRGAARSARRAAPMLAAIRRHGASQRRGAPTRRRRSQSVAGSAPRSIGDAGTSSPRRGRVDAARSTPSRAAARRSARRRHRRRAAARTAPSTARSTRRSAKPRRRARAPCASRPNSCGAPHADGRRDAASRESQRAGADAHRRGADAGHAGTADGAGSAARSRRAPQRRLPTRSPRSSTAWPTT